MLNAKAARKNSGTPSQSHRCWYKLTPTAPSLGKPSPFVFSSRVLFNISQKLILHQLANYTEILKWLREILACRNKFLSRNKDNANVGSSNRLCNQAHIKLEVIH